MERKFYTDDFELLLKERSDEFRMYPSKRVWSSIYNDLHPGRKWPSIAVSLMLIAALIITGYWNSNNEKRTSSTTSASIYTTTSTTGQGVIKSYATTHNLLPTGNNFNTVLNIVPTDKNAAKETIAKNNTSAYYGTGVKSNTAIAYQSKPVKHFIKITNEKKASANLISKNNTDNKIFNAPVVTAEIAATLSNTPVSEEINSTADLDKTTPASINNTIVKSEAANTDAISNVTINENIVVAEKQIVTKPAVAVAKNISSTDKAWIDDYAFYNKSSRKKWKDRLAKEFYITPSIGYRKFSNNSPYDASASAQSSNAATNSSLNTAVTQKPGMGMEAGIGLVYSLSKNIRIKAGVQANYTSYTIYADETNHPILTTLRLTDINTGYPYMSPRTATLSNSSGLNSAKAHNKTYQLSIPLGLAFKLAGNDKLEWYAGASLQPTFVIGGKANLISDDRKNYVSDATLMRHWSLNSGFETYINYKFSGFTLQVGPQFRYQLVSTYNNQYTLNENLYNAGLKIGILKNF